MPPPILLLKTQSTPTDAYAEYFSAQNYTPIFIPVLEHDFHAENLQSIKSLFDTGALGPDPSRRKYGGIIFTSQRAVEGFASIVGDIHHDIKTNASRDMILYTVGPATSRSLSALITPDHLPHATIHGADTGNGENLAHFILEHYNQNFPSQTQSQSQSQSQAQSDTDNGKERETKPPLLFLVGEQRRDIIPRTLTTQAPARRIDVDEITVYETRVQAAFEDAFRRVLTRDLAAEDVIWVVVFSPTGCEAMLRVLREVRQEEGKKVFVATIGPTTRDHLRGVFGFEPHVCAERPSSEGVGEGIRRFMGC